MCESSNPVNYSRSKISFADDCIDEDEKKIEEAFTKLSAHTIAKLIEDEPDGLLAIFYGNRLSLYSNSC